MVGEFDRNPSPAAPAAVGYVRGAAAIGADRPGPSQDAGSDPDRTARTASGAVVAAVAAVGGYESVESQSVVDYQPNSPATAAANIVIIRTAAGAQIERSIGRTVSPAAESVVSGISTAPAVTAAGTAIPGPGLT